MSASTRVKPGVPTGGQFAATEKSEPNLTPLTPGLSLSSAKPLPEFPDRRAFAAQFQNRAQRSDRLNERLHDIATHPRCLSPERVSAARMAMDETLDFYGRFVSLPEDDGEAASIVTHAARNDAKIFEALDRVGALEDFEARSFGNRVAGALHDIETAEREDKAAHESAMAAHAAGEEPSWSDEEPEEFYTW